MVRMTGMPTEARMAESRRKSASHLQIKNKATFRWLLFFIRVYVGFRNAPTDFSFSSA